MAGRLAGRGTRCQSSSVRKGIIGWSRRSDVSSACASTVAASPFAAAPSGEASRKTGFVTSRYQSQNSFQKNR